MMAGPGEKFPGPFHDQQPRSAAPSTPHTCQTAPARLGYQGNARMAGRSPRAHSLGMQYDPQAGTRPGTSTEPPTGTPTGLSPDRVTDDVLWDKVLNRQEATDFLYAVTTMGVYCRPGCPSPRPLRRNVRFFRCVAEAEAAGFRACKRCDPKGDRARIAQAVVQDACAFIEASETIPSLETLANRAGYSRFHFLRLFRDHTGLTPRSYAEGVRARRLHAALADGARVVDAVAEAGYGSESRVYEKTAALLGMTPGSSRRGGAGERIRTAFADCPFGRLLVGATDKGVCFIGFAEPDAALMGDLRRRFPQATIEADDAALAGTVRAVLDFLQEPKQALDLPLDLRGTAFQQRVWRTLCTIPPGETRTYAQLADMTGNPRAIRAVARSCATNPVSLAVPCHRVVGSDGGLTGYRWGVPRKQALLTREGALPKPGRNGAPR
ncbi:MAG TPA: bifunctional DNA-binding transcriptional regulator/O6-methylguanine-DNA methyltransferase Ada [Rhodopila sp.]|nr:bifunctional DNA-binding transcriptional regulator/O6-methylguanine-DNA methyltransferase Ada [Rhodopila sp.]